MLIYSVLLIVLCTRKLLNDSERLSYYFPYAPLKQKQSFSFLERNVNFFFCNRSMISPMFEDWHSLYDFQLHALSLFYHKVFLLLTLRIASSTKNTAVYLPIPVEGSTDFIYITIGKNGK